MSSRSLAAAVAAPALALALALAAPAAAQTGELTGEITEVTETDVESTVLIDLGREDGVAVGQTIEVRRGDQAIGYGTVTNAFSDVSVGTVGTVASGASPLRRGDAVVVRGAGFAAGDEEGETVEVDGEVVSTRGGVIVIDAGREQGVAVGFEAAILDADGEEKGRIVVELVDEGTAVGMLVLGEAAEGDAARIVGRPRGRGSDGGLDFVALSFLGVVAHLEHATRHRAPCHLGVPVRRVLGGSPAQRAGIGPSDRVIAVDGRVVREVSEIRERIETRSADVIQVLILRDDRVVQVAVDFR